MNRPPCQICWRADCNGNPCPDAEYDNIILHIFIIYYIKSHIHFNLMNGPPCQICWRADCNGNPCPDAEYDKNNQDYRYKYCTDICCLLLTS
jgi:hypothetical protein